MTRLDLMNLFNEAEKKIYLAYNTLVKRSAEYICNTIYGYGSKIQVLDQETT